jgi:5S rRNA maturation endonuclease (ribonuclease M5)
MNNLIRFQNEIKVRSDEFNNWNEKEPDKRDQIIKKIFWELKIGEFENIRLKMTEKQLIGKIDQIVTKDDMILFDCDFRGTKISIFRHVLDSYGIKIKKNSRVKWINGKSQRMHDIYNLSFDEEDLKIVKLYTHQKKHVIFLTILRNCITCLHFNGYIKNSYLLFWLFCYKIDLLQIMSIVTYIDTVVLIITMNKHFFIVHIEI